MSFVSTAGCDSVPKVVENLFKTYLDFKLRNVTLVQPRGTEGGSGAKAVGRNAYRKG